METTLTGLEPIPVEYVVTVAQSKRTEAQRRPYIELVERWGDEQGKLDDARMALRRLRQGEEIDVHKMPREFMPRYRQPENAKQLVEIVRTIDDIIASKQEQWTWAHVMRVMVDEGIIYQCTVNRFDQLVCAMIPGKGRDNVRKNGDYSIMRGDSWTLLPTQSYLDPTAAANRVCCNQIALLFAPVLQRTIKEDF
ncbi:MAG: hypothetical protein IJ633_01005 [Prevotella sp.]|nr:hypothetical protein [Prevotella sp.]